MNAQKLIYKVLPTLITTILFMNAGVIFLLRYGNNPAVIPLLFDTDENINRLLFYLNFFIPVIICWAAVYGCIFLSNFFTRGICIVTGFASAILSVYIFDDFFVLNFCLYTAYLIAVSISTGFPKNIILTLCSTVLFLFFMYHPQFMGTGPQKTGFIRPSVLVILPLLTAMLFLAVSMVLIHILVEKYTHALETITHLDMVEKKLVLFNHNLQELAKKSGAEAVKQDRLRFTQDLHDSCGYAFTNIILVSDAAVSRGKIEIDQIYEIFHKIRNLASKGLQETRETLHLIRKIQEPYAKSVETVYQLKTIFEDATGIRVDIEWGNMKIEYGPVINKILARIIQESFTNSVRHGKATHIVIRFWEFNHKLSMIVTDNGIGAQVIVKGIGLAGMEERLHSVGGKIDVALPPEGGFRLIITIPIIEGKVYG
jgi:signal transduction histidine kinase